PATPGRPPFAYTTLFRSAAAPERNVTTPIRYGSGPCAKAVEAASPRAASVKPRRTFIGSPPFVLVNVARLGTAQVARELDDTPIDRKSTRLNSSHVKISY